MQHMFALFQDLPKKEREETNCNEEELMYVLHLLNNFIQDFKQMLLQETETGEKSLDLVMGSVFESLVRAYLQRMIICITAQ